MDDPGHHGGGCDPARSRESDALARLVEAEILPRLMLVHRTARPAPGEAPDLDRPERLAAFLLRSDSFDLDAAVDRLLDGGMALDRLLLDLLAPAARHLGTLWEDDDCDFLAVTEGLGRLQALARRLCLRMERARGPAGRSVLLMPCPGETHVFGLSVLASLFREGGWDVTTLLDAQADAAEVLREGWYDVLGLSLSCDVLAPALKAAVPVLRRASCNPGLVVLVGGPYFGRTSVGAAAFGADAQASDGLCGPEVAEALLDRPALAC